MQRFESTLALFIRHNTWSLLIYSCSFTDKELVYDSTPQSSIYRFHNVYHIAGLFRGRKLLKNRFW